RLTRGGARGRPGTPSARPFASTPGLRRRSPPRACSSTRALRYLDRVSAIFAATGYSAPEAMILGAELASAGPAGAPPARAGPPRGWGGGGGRRGGGGGAGGGWPPRPVGPLRPPGAGGGSWGGGARAGRP